MIMHLLYVPSAVSTLEPVICAVGFKFQLTSMYLVRSCTLDSNNEKKAIHCIIG